MRERNGSQRLACDQAAPRAKSDMPFAGGGMFSPSTAYSLSLLRSVRIELPTRSPRASGCPGQRFRFRG